MPRANVVSISVTSKSKSPPSSVRQALPATNDSGPRSPSFADKFFIVTGASQVAGFFRNRFPGQFTYVGAFGGQHFAARISYTGNAAAGLTTGGHDIVLHDFTVIPAPPTLEILPAAPGRFSFRWLSASGWNYQTRYALPGSFPTFYVIPGAISSGTGGYVTNTFPILQGPPDPDKNAGPWTNSPNVFFNVELVVP